MRKAGWPIALVLLLGWGMALADSFDLFEYTPPQGWKKDSQEGAVILSLQSQKSFGAIVLYASLPAGKDLEQNFRGEWKRLVKEGLGISGEPNTDKGPPNGDYQNMVGAIAAKQDGVDYVVVLSTFSGNGRVASVLYITTDPEHLDLFDQFNSSLKLSKPKATQPPPAAGNRNIAAPTTRFDDGWVATVERDFVRVAKGDVLVLLYYTPSEMSNAPDSNMGEDVVIPYWWNRLVAPRYKVDELKIFKNERPCYTCLYFGEGSATEVASGARKHVALYLLYDKVVFAIQAVAPDFATFHKVFPNIEALGKMYGYNKFAVRASDLTGTWKEGFAGAAQYYNSVTGAYAGMNVVSSTNTFTFNRDGTYTSKHAGASGFVGSQQVYSVEYRGRVSLKDWEISLSNRPNKTVVYEAYFQMTRAGPVLNLIQVDARGMHYRLVRENP